MIFKLLIIHMEIIYMTNNFLTAYQVEDDGRLQSQFRVFPTDGIPSTFYACPKNGLILCSRDLQGYHECIDDGLGPLNKCPKGTRCACQLDGACESNISEVCVTAQAPYPMLDKVTFYYKGYTIKNFLSLYPKDNKERKSLWGVIKQDVKKGKFLQVNTNKYYPFKTFELIVPDGKDQFIKYMGTDEECFNTTIPTFQPFGYDIKNYHLQSNKKLTKDRRLQTWTFKAGFNGVVWIDWSWKWTILADRLTNTSLPVKSFYYEAGKGPLYKQYAFWDVSTLDAPLKKENNWYGKELVDPDWFGVPSICK